MNILDNFTEYFIYKIFMYKAIGQLRFTLKAKELFRMIRFNT